MACLNQRHQNQYRFNLPLLSLYYQDEYVFFPYMTFYPLSFFLLVSQHNQKFLKICNCNLIYEPNLFQKLHHSSSTLVGPYHSAVTSEDSNHQQSSQLISHLFYQEKFAPLPCSFKFQFFKDEGSGSISQAYLNLCSLK